MARGGKGGQYSATADQDGLAELWVARGAEHTAEASLPGFKRTREKLRVGPGRILRETCHRSTEGAVQSSVLDEGWNPTTSSMRPFNRLIR